jgi:hypothetical protein
MEWLWLAPGLIAAGAAGGVLAGLFGVGVLIAAPAALGMVLAGWGLEGRGPGALGFVSLPGMALMLPTGKLATPWGVRVAWVLPAAHFGWVLPA